LSLCSGQAPRTSRSSCLGRSERSIQGRRKATGCCLVYCLLISSAPPRAAQPGQLSCSRWSDAGRLEQHQIALKSKGAAAGRDSTAAGCSKSKQHDNFSKAQRTSAQRDAFLRSACTRGHCCLFFACLFCFLCLLLLLFLACLFRLLLCLLVTCFLVLLPFILCFLHAGLHSDRPSGSLLLRISASIMLPRPA
jgi:hypothetical protein